MTADWLDSLQSFGWRGVAIILVVALLTYALSVLLRLRRLGHREHGAAHERIEPPPPPPITGRTIDARDDDADIGAATTYAPSASGLSDAKRLDAVEREQIALRDQIIALRRAIKTLQEDFENRLAEVELQARSGQHVSPLYGDAMQMALAGYDAAAIAERCGIPRGEADLVVALVHQSDNLNEGERGEDGGQSRR